MESPTDTNTHMYHIRIETLLRGFSFTYPSILKISRCIYERTHFNNIIQHIASARVTGGWNINLSFIYTTHHYTHTYFTWICTIFALNLDRSPYNFSQVHLCVFLLSILYVPNSNVFVSLNFLLIFFHFISNRHTCLSSCCSSCCCYWMFFWKWKFMFYYMHTQALPYVFGNFWSITREIVVIWVDISTYNLSPLDNFTFFMVYYCQRGTRWHVQI